MTERVKFWQSAGTVNIPGKGEFPQRYAPDAFDGFIGQDAPFRIEGGEIGRATIVAVKVAEDGSGAEWTVDIEDDIQLDRPDRRRVVSRESGLDGDWQEVAE